MVRGQSRRPIRIVVAVVLIATAVGCGKSKGRHKISRNRDAAAVVLVSGTEPTGALEAENEPNNDVGSAQPLSAGGGVRAVLDGETDQDFYLFESDRDGHVSAIAAGVDGLDLMIEIRSEAGRLLAKSDRGPAATSEGVPNLPVEAKKRYLVVVAEYVKKHRKRMPREGPSAPYDLRLRLEAEPEQRHEREPNEGEDGAVQLAIPDEVFGFLGWSEDSDLWRVPLDGVVQGGSGGADAGAVAPVNALDIDLEAVEGVTFKLEVLDQVERVLLTRVGPKSGSVAVRGFVPSDEEYLLLRVSGKRSHPEQPYVLKVQSRVADTGREWEPNDAPDRATLLAQSELGLREIKGLLGAGDVDHFKLPQRPEPQLVGVTLQLPSGLDGIVEIVTPGGRLLAAADTGKEGSTEVLNDIAVPAEAVALVRVRPVGAPKQAGEYQLTWSAVSGSAASDPLTPDLGDLVDTP